MHSVLNHPFNIAVKIQAQEKFIKHFLPQTSIWPKKKYMNYLSSPIRFNKKAMISNIKSEREVFDQRLRAQRRMAVDSWICEPHTIDSIRIGISESVSWWFSEYGKPSETDMECYMSRFKVFESKNFPNSPWFSEEAKQQRRRKILGSCIPLLCVDGKRPLIPFKSNLRYITCASRVLNS